MSPNPSESRSGPSGVNPENEIYVCDGLKCKPFDQEEESHQEVEESQKKPQCADCGQSFKITTLLKNRNLPGPLDGPAWGSTSSFSRGCWVGTAKNIKHSLQV